MAVLSFRLMIAALRIRHNAELITFDAGSPATARGSKLRIQHRSRRKRAFAS